MAVASLLNFLNVSVKTFCLRFNGHFSDEPELAGVY